MIGASGKKSVIKGSGRRTRGGLRSVVIPAQAGIHVDPIALMQKEKMDSRLRGNDGQKASRG
jgi:hypothetical protein